MSKADNKELEEAIEVLNIASGKKDGFYVFTSDLSKATETVLKELKRLQNENNENEKMIIDVPKNTKAVVKM